MDNIKQVVKDIKFLIATNCCDETIQARIENFINDRDQALRIHDVSVSVCKLDALKDGYCENYRCKADCIGCDFYKQTEH